MNMPELSLECQERQSPWLCGSFKLLQPSLSPGNEPLLRHLDIFDAPKALSNSIFRCPYALTPFAGIGFHDCIQVFAGPKIRFHFLDLPSDTVSCYRPDCGLRLLP
jgi:hypothetical protein